MTEAQQILTTEQPLMQPMSPPGLNRTIHAIDSHLGPFDRLAAAIAAFEDACACADQAELDYRVAKAEAMLAATGKNAEHREAEVTIKTAERASAAHSARRRADAIEHLVIFLRGQT